LLRKGSSVPARSIPPHSIEPVGPVALEENRPERIDEGTLLVRIRAGEKRLFHDLILPYERGVYLTAYSVLHNEGDAEEVAQETILKAYTHLGELRQDVTFKAWLLRIALNEARMRRRKNHSQLYEPLEEEESNNSNNESFGTFSPGPLVDWREVPSESLERKEIRQAVARALRTLPAIHRDVFVLRDVQELGVEETAKVLAISVAAVKTRLHRARLQMREALTPIFRLRWHDRLLFRKGTKPW
jgi:RNA polymerase sigma-70 factor, ECF subfamily